MMGQKKVEIFLVKIRKSLTKQFSEAALIKLYNINNKLFNLENRIFSHFSAHSVKYSSLKELSLYNTDYQY